MTDNNKNKIIPVSLESLSVESPAGICSTCNIIPVTKKSLVINDTQCHKTTPMHSSALVNKNLNIYNSIESSKPKQAAQKISIPTPVDTSTSVDPATNSGNGVYQPQPSNLTPVTPNPVKRVEKCDGTDTFVISTEKDVYVNTYETVYEQKFIENTNITGSVIQVGEISGSCYSNKVSCANALGFDTDSGFEVTNFGAGIAKIAMNSTFKYWNVNGNPGLIACGVDTMNFIAGSGITITSDNTAVPKTLTINSTGGGGVSLDAYCSLAIGNGLSTSTGYNNFAIGYDTLICNSTGSNNVAIGYNNLKSNTYGNNNIALGANNLTNNTYGYGNVAIGCCALANNIWGYGNFAIGLNSLKSASCGTYNVAIGMCTLQDTTDGFDNIALGHRALQCTTNGFNNVAIGFLSLINNVTGSCNIAIGFGTLNNKGTGCGNIAIGWNANSGTYASENNITIGTSAGCALTSGSNNNTIIGKLTGNSGLACTVLIGAGTCERVKVDNTGLYINGACWCSGGGGGVSLDAYCSFKVGNGLASSAGYNNFAFGLNALKCNLTGGNNIAIGKDTLCNSISTVYGSEIQGNVALGYGVLRSTTTGYGNVGIGYKALHCAGNVGSNVAIGTNAMICSTHGSVNIAIGYDALRNVRSYNNVAIGYGALKENISGFNNVAIGQYALCNNISGINNIAIGPGALKCTGSTGNPFDQANNNIAIGSCALSKNLTGSQNIAIGEYSGYNNINGVNNTFVGQSSGVENTTGSNNVFIGIGAGSGNTFGHCNTAIGSNAGINNLTGCNNTFLGNNSSPATSNSSNTIILGNSSITCIRAQVTTISALSDARDKTDVEELPLGIQFIMDLRPVKFTWNMRDGGKVGVEDSGFIAQEVAALEDNNGVTQWLDMVGRENPEKLEVKPAKLIPILVKAIQDLNNKLTSEISRLEQEILSLKSSIQ